MKIKPEWVSSAESLSGFVEGAVPPIIGIKKGELTLKSIDKRVCNKIIIDNHYSHKTATDAVTQLYLGIFYKDKLLGAMQYGYAMNPASCKNIVKGTEIDEYLELNRLWIDDSIPIRFVESQIIGMSFRLIKKIRPKVKWIQSFADGRVGHGTIYQATNFLYCGSHEQSFVELDGKLHHIAKFSDSRKSFGKRYKHILSTLKKHTHKQYRYIYFLHKEERKNLLLQVSDYPTRVTYINTLPIPL